MVDPKELRIGNWVLFGDGELFPFTKVQVGSLNADLPGYLGEGINSGSPGIYSGIPLTPEILTDWCGFENVEDGFYIHMSRQSFRVAKDGLDGDNEWYVFLQEDIGCRFEFLTFANYLHELQNVIYWTTNDPRKELEIIIPTEKV